MKAADVLRAAAALVRKGWTQGTNARDERGNDVSPHSRLAACWCLDGAICASLMSEPVESRTSLYEATSYAVRSEIGAYIGWNDAPGRTAEEVASAIERVAANLDGAS